jgi:beta-N-acetylhexosaminidase
MMGAMSWQALTGGHRRPWWLVAVASAVVIVLAAVAVRVVLRPTAAAVRGTGSTPGVSAGAATTVPSPTPAPTSTLTARQLAGQRVIYSYPGLTPPASLLDHIRAGEVAGVIFFEENISSAGQIAGVVAKLRDAQRQSPVKAPLLLMTDQEGGGVKRLPGQPTESAKRTGQSSDPRAAATRAGAGAAATLGGAGMNVNLAPVVDVYTTAGNFIDEYGRSYSNNANTVADLGADFLTAQQKAGVAATAKHFPGLGAAPQGKNTDAGPVTLSVGLSTLRGRDEVPYTAAIAAGVRLVMLSWAVYPALDGSRPAGLSPAVVGSELRGRLKFGGVTVTDALEAGALKSYGTTAQRAVLAAQAGMDLILCSARDLTQGESATTALADTLTTGAVDRGTFQAAVDRVTALRAGLA